MAEKEQTRACPWVRMTFLEGRSDGQIALVFGHQPVPAQPGVTGKWGRFVDENEANAFWYSMLENKDKALEAARSAQAKANAMEREVATLQESLKNWVMATNAFLLWVGKQRLSLMDGARFIHPGEVHSAFVQSLEKFGIQVDHVNTEEVC